LTWSLPSVRHSRLLVRQQEIAVAASAVHVVAGSIAAVLVGARIKVVERIKVAARMKVADESVAVGNRWLSRSPSLAFDRVALLLDYTTTMVHTIAVSEPSYGLNQTTRVHIAISLITT
jgi:hypothetical protein